MPWRLIGFIVLFALFLVFIGFNLENRCDISFGSSKLTIYQVPVYLTAFSSFVLGMLWAVPYIISLRLKQKPGQDVVKEKEKPGPGKGRIEDKDKNKNKDKETLPEPGGPYGID
jgi:uncharacterized integral membrane protein